MKKLMIIIGVVLLCFAGIWVIKDQVIKSVVTLSASQILGAPVHIDRFSFNIFTSTIRISGLKIYNPSGFPKGILVSCSHINVIYDGAALLKHRLHLPMVEVELDEMGLTKNKKGKFNVDSLKVTQQSKASGPAMPMRIDVLTLGIGKIVDKDYTMGLQPSVRVHEVNIHKSYKNITSAQQLAILVLAEPVKAAGIKTAEIYGVAMLAGVAVLPVGIVATFVGKDSVQQTVNGGFEYVYAASLKVVKGMGKVIEQDEANGVIKADISGARVALKFRKITDHKTEITISARKYFLPMPDIAGGVLYQIQQNTGSK